MIEQNKPALKVDEREKGFIKESPKIYDENR